MGISLDNSATWPFNFLKPAASLPAMVLASRIALLNSPLSAVMELNWLLSCPTALLTLCKPCTQALQFISDFFNVSACSMVPRITARRPSADWARALKPLLSVSILNVIDMVLLPAMLFKD